MPGPRGTVNWEDSVPKVTGPALIGQYPGGTFEKLLSRYGAVFNGTSDDAPAIQNALNAIAAGGNFQQVAFPEGGLTARIASAVGGAVGLTSSGYTNGCLLSIPVNVSIDFNNTFLDCYRTAANQVALWISNSGGVTGQGYGLNRTVYERARLRNGTTDLDLLLLGGDTVLGPNRVKFREFLFEGGSNQVKHSNNAFLTKFENCEFYAVASTGSMFSNLAGLGTNQGENVAFSQCAFYNSFGNAINLSVGTRINMFSCSFDYVRRVVLITATSTQPCIVNLFGCHIEQRKQDGSYGATPNFLVEIDNAATTSRVSMFGGEIFISNNTTGTNRLAAVFSSGVTASKSPYGIVVDGPLKTLNNGALFDAASTGDMEYRLGGINPNKAQDIAYAATINTNAAAGNLVRVGTLTGAPTIAAPTTPLTGQRLRYEFVQDGTGGRNVTWDAVFTFPIGAWSNTGNTLGTRSSVEFEYNGTNWVQFSPQNVWW